MRRFAASSRRGRLASHCQYLAAMSEQGALCSQSARLQDLATSPCLTVSTGRKQVTVKVMTQLRIHVACQLACVKRQSSLHCNCGTDRRGARVKKDSMRFRAI